MRVRLSTEKAVLAATFIAGVGLTGCAGGNPADTDSAPASSAVSSPHPDESVLSAKAVPYENAADLRSAFEDSGYDCAEWSEMDIEGAEHAGTCSDGKDQFLVFEDEESLTSYRDDLSARDGADPARYLFGPNWTAHASATALLVVRNHIGGQLGWE